MSENEKNKAKDTLITNILALENYANLGDIDIAEAMGLSKSTFCAQKKNNFASLPAWKLNNLVNSEIGVYFKLTESDFFISSPKMFINKLKEATAVRPISPVNGYEGIYYIYLFDQVSSSFGSSVDEGRRLRFGIMYLKKDKDGGSLSSYAVFFKRFDEAQKLYTEVSSHYDYKKEEPFFSYKDIYKGTTEIVGNHIFINLSNSDYTDKASFIANKPDASKGSEYIGGLYALLSVSHGSNKCPVNQKAIISKYMIDISEEEIGSYLNMFNNNIKLDDEADALLEFTKSLNVVINSNEFRGLFSSSGEIVGDGDGNLKKALSDILDENSRKTLFLNKFEHIVKAYIEKNLTSVSVISPNDDDAVYDLIKSCIGKE